MLIRLVLIFIAGLIIDLLVTTYTRFVAEKKLLGAVFLSIGITLINVWFITLLIQDFSNLGAVSIITFASGNGLGTFLALKR